MKKLNTKIKIVMTGPESSGKTTLANQLADALQAELVPEFSRDYLENLNRPYEYQDLFPIAAGQKQREAEYEQNSEINILILDTDWTVIRIWELYKFGTTHVTESETLQPDTYYFLCAPDIPWQADPFREHPEERDNLFALYFQLLSDLNAPFTVLRGDAAQRLETALEIIRKLY